MHSLKLNEEQLKAAYHTSGPALALAVPGSGKTTLLLFRIVNLVTKHGTNPNKILSVTFSKASAKDMENRYKKLFPNNKSINPSFSTIHSFCYNIVSQYFKKKNLSYSLLEGSNGKSKIHIMKNLSSEILTTPLSDEGLEQLQNEISYFKNMMFTSENYDKEKFSTENFIKIYDLYEKYKSNHHLIDFDDMLTITHKILSESKITCKYFENKYDYIQIDEAQDTSNIQFEILKMISGKNKNLFFVADDDQSIYSFRGANPQNLLNFKSIFSNGIIYKLTANYRSANKICNLCNNFISQNNFRYPKKMHGINDDMNLGNIQVINFETVENRNEHLIKELKKCNKKTAILFRNNVSSIGLSYILYKRDIDFFIKDKSLGFFNHFIAKDLECFFNLALASNDIDSFGKIYYKMDIFIKEDVMNYIYSNNRGRNIFDTLMEYDGFTKNQKKKLTELKFSFEKIAETSAYGAIQIIENEIGYIKFLDRISKNKNSSLKNFQNQLLQFKIIAKFNDSIMDYLSEIESFKNIVDASSRNYSALINFSTFHSSKGLEYENVFIIDAPDLVKEEGKIDLLEEERRLFYVAMTRAKNNLFLLNCKFKEGHYEKKSPFLSFVEAHDSVEVVDLKTDNQPQSLNLSISDVICHSIFGQGTILNIDGDSITINFKDKERTLSQSICIEKNFIEKRRF